jgi:hypothetical protein
VLRELRRRLLLSGPLSGNRRWTYLWLIVMSLRLLNRMRHPTPEVVFSEKLKPGDSLMISGVDREPRVIGGRAAAR